VEIFVAWGYRDERHCRFHAFWDCGDWGHPSRAALGYASGLAGAWSAYREGDREPPAAQPADALAGDQSGAVVWKNATGGAVIRDSLTFRSNYCWSQP